MLSVGIAVCMFVFSAVLAVVATASPAHACSLVPTYSLPSDLLVDGDFNDPDSAFAQDYEAFAWDGEPAPDIQGVHRAEVVEATEPVVLGGGMEISRGSVAIVTDYWGEAPAELGPYTIGRPKIWERVPDSGACEFLSYPPNRAVGSVFYVVTTTSDEPISLPGNSSSLDHDLDAGFGGRTSPAHDVAATRALIAELQAEHDAAVAEASETSLPLILGGGAIGVALVAALGYRVKTVRP